MFKETFSGILTCCVVGTIELCDGEALTFSIVCMRHAQVSHVCQIRLSTIIQDATSSCDPCGWYKAKKAYPEFPVSSTYIAQSPPSCEIYKGFMILHQPKFAWKLGVSPLLFLCGKQAECFPFGCPCYLEIVPSRAWRVKRPAPSPVEEL